MIGQWVRIRAGSPSDWLRYSFTEEVPSALSKGRARETTRTVSTYTGQGGGITAVLMGRKPLATLQRWHTLLGSGFTAFLHPCLSEGEEAAPTRHPSPFITCLKNDHQRNSFFTVCLQELWSWPRWIHFSGRIWKNCCEFSVFLLCDGQRQVSLCTGMWLWALQ